MRQPLRLLPLLALSICLPGFADDAAPAAQAIPAVVTRATEVHPIPASAIEAPVATPTAPAHSCAEVKAFKDRLHKAINDALKYPHAMSLHPVVGVTNIAYDYFDGKPRNVRITMRSGDET